MNDNLDGNEEVHANKSKENLNYMGSGLLWLVDMLNKTIFRCYSPQAMVELLQPTYNFDFVDIFIV